MEFLDTSILVYGFDQTSSFKQEVAKGLIKQLLSQESGVVSWQVVQEFANVVCNKFVTVARPVHAAAFIDEVIEPMNRVASSTELIHAALALKDELRYSFYDSLIIAAALHARCTTLYSEDLQHGQVVRASLQIVNPFVDAVHEPLAVPVVSYQLRYTGK